MALVFSDFSLKLVMSRFWPVFCAHLQDARHFGAPNFQIPPGNRTNESVVFAL